MRVSIIALAAAAVLSTGLRATSAPAKGGRPMSLLDIAELSRAADPQLSPDGRYVVYALSHADWKVGRALWQLWRQEVGGGAPLQLTFTPTGMIPGSTRWSPDGKSILFMRDGQFVLMPADGGEAKPFTRHATGVSSPTWAPDGSA